MSRDVYHKEVAEMHSYFRSFYSSCNAVIHVIVLQLCIFNASVCVCSDKAPVAVRGGA